jgi:hypothetical protein
MIELLPSEGQPMVLNRKKSRHRKMVALSREELVSERTPFLTLIRPVGNDGSIDHAVYVVDDLIFDARLPNTLGPRVRVAGLFVSWTALADDTDVLFLVFVSLPFALPVLFVAALLALEALLEDALVDDFEPVPFAIVLLLVCLLRLGNVVDPGCRG